MDLWGINALAVATLALSIEINKEINVFANQLAIMRLDN